jgi:hypothetical protein
VSPRAVVLDSNLLVLLVVGLTDPHLIGRHKRLKAYDQDDLSLLQNLLAQAGRIVVTPNTLTETSNLLAYIEEPARSRIREAFRLLIRAVDEEFVPSRTAAEALEFRWLGLTDAALLEVTDESYTLLTADLDLYLASLKRGASALNFNHLRDQTGPG